MAMFRMGDAADESVAEERGSTGQLAIQRLDSSEVLYRPREKTVKMIGRFIIGDLLGEGSYGKVKECLDSVSLGRFAVKIMKSKRLRKIPNGMQHVRKEIRLLRRLHHPHVVSLIDVIYNHAKEKIYVFLEYCVGNVQELLDSAPGKQLPPGQAQRCFAQLMSGLEYLHGQGVVHRDIKPGNMLLSADGTVRITDFGVADELSPYTREDACTSSSGSPAFQSPELANGVEVFSGCKVDVWAAGVTLWNMVSGTYPFEGDTIFALYAAIGQGAYTLPPGLSTSLAHLLQGMLTVDPAARMAVTDICMHPWVHEPLPPCVDVRFSPSAAGGTHRGTTVLQYLDALFKPPPSQTSPSAFRVRSASLPVSLAPAPAPSSQGALRKLLSWFS